MVEVDWASIRLLDCPIVQRLRAIKQLGFSYLTYPSAEHSRFVHSLGMYAVVSRFLDAMDRSVERKELEVLEGVRPYKVDDSLRSDLLHAAILHDVGHFPFSHATESSLKNSQLLFRCGPFSIEDFLFHINEHLQEDVPLAEGLSLALVLSPRFDTFYKNHVRPGAEDPNVLLRIAALIAGLRPEPKHRGAAQLISDSAIDSDKVDYINRDALACGIPIGIDVARLFLRSAFYEVEPKHLKQLIPYANPTHDEVIFIVNSSGVDTIDELANAKLSLYQRVYLHQTTRNAERLLTKCLEALPPAGEKNAELRDAVTMLGEDDASLLRALSEHPKEEVRVLSLRLRNRQLPKRSCVFGRTLLTLLMPVDQVLPRASLMEASKHTLGLIVEKLRHTELTGNNLAALEKAILEEAAKLKKLLLGIASDLLPSGDAPQIVAVLPMTEIEGPRREAVVLENNELIHSSHRTISDEQGDAADLYKALGYVVTDAPWREIVCLAARKVFATSYREPARPMALARSMESGVDSLNVRTAGRLVLDLKTVIRRTGLNASRIRELQRSAEKTGWFDDAPSLVSVEDADVAAIAMKLRKFDGEQGWTVSPASCASFIAQFPPRFRNELRSLLDTNLHIIDRDVIRSNLLSIIRKIKADTPGVVRVTGLTPDSGNVVRMLLEQEAHTALKAEGIELTKTIHDCLSKHTDKDTIVFCDDNISSGAQAQSQFRAWFDVPRAKWPEEHRRVSGIEEAALSPEDSDRLKAGKVAIAICEGLGSAQPGIREALKSLGMLNFCGLFIGQETSPAAHLTSPELYEYMKKAGAELIAYCRYGSERGLTGLSADKVANCERDGAGYGDGRGLRCTYLNVPTSTFTCLWAPGWVGGNPWIPLLIRRGYLERLIVA
jgi:HD superfamily phosphohydrolase